MLQGKFKVIAAGLPKPYNFEGRTGVSLKITLRDLKTGESFEVKANTDVPWSSHLDKEPTILFKIVKGGFIKADSVVG